MKTETAESNVHMRMQSSKLDVIDRAAQLLGASRSQFVTNVAFTEATNILLDQCVVKTTAKSFNEILEWLDNPKSPEEIAGLKRLKATKRLW